MSDLKVPGVGSGNLAGEGEASTLPTWGALTTPPSCLEHARANHPRSSNGWFPSSVAFCGLGSGSRWRSGPQESSWPRVGVCISPAYRGKVIASAHEEAIVFGEANLPKPGWYQVIVNWLQAEAWVAAWSLPTVHWGSERCVEGLGHPGPGGVQGMVGGIFLVVRRQGWRRHPHRSRVVSWDRSKIWDVSLSRFIKWRQNNDDSHRCLPEGCAVKQISWCQHGFSQSPPPRLFPEVGVQLLLELHLLAGQLGIDVRNCQCPSDYLTSGSRPLPPSSQRPFCACFLALEGQGGVRV